MSLKKPGIAITVFPDLLGSLGTANTPHRRAIANGSIITKATLDIPENLVQLQNPREIKQMSSNKNLSNKFIEFDPKRLPLVL